MSYRQFRADFAKAAWLQHMGDWDHEEAAQSAVARADALIAELERTEACPCEDERCDLPLGHEGQHQSIKNGLRITWGRGCSKPIESFQGILKPEPEPPAPDLPRLGTGWKWAPGDGTHKTTPFDFTYSKLSQRQFCGVSGWLIGRQWQSFQPLATPDWHNPENIESPGEGYRFLVKGEAARNGDEYFAGTYWTPNTEVKDWEWRLWTHRTTRPLPPVLAQDEKEAQP